MEKGISYLKNAVGLYKKIKEKNDIELTMEEIKTLYEIDDYLYINSNQNVISSAREYRDDYSYDDLCKVFGKDLIARDNDEINENTLVYVGDLVIDKVLPTYNLKYIYGSLLYNPQPKIVNLENLERVYGHVSLLDIDNLEGLESLEYIGNGLEVDSSNSLDGIDSITYYNELDLKNIKDSKGLVIPKNVKNFLIHNDDTSILEYSNITFKSSIVSYLAMHDVERIDNIIFPIRVSELDLSFAKEIYNVIFPDYCDTLYLESLEIMKTNNFPKECAELSMEAINHIDYCILPEKLAILRLNNLRSAKGLLLPREIRNSINMFYVKDFDGIFIPNSIVDKLSNYYEEIPEESIINDDEYEIIKKSIERYQNNELTEPKLKEVLESVRTNKRKVKRRY